MLLKNLINNLPEDKKKIVIKGLSVNSKEIKKGYIFFAIKGTNTMEKSILKKQLIKVHL